MKIVYFSYLVAVNLYAFVLYGTDKARAIKGRWRISESSLLLAAALGGAGGALLGMLVFRHKTRHTNFVVMVPAFLVLHLVLYLGLIKNVL